MELAILIGIPLFSIIFGYFLWKTAINNYDYNIYSIGVLIRLIIALFSFIVNIYLGIALLLIFSIWNFFITWKNTSFFIAFFAVIFQPIALIFAISAINKVLREIND